MDRIGLTFEEYAELKVRPRVGAVIAALTALGGYLLYTSGAGGKALSWLGERFKTLRDDAVASYQGIADALAAGDIGLAVKILWLTIKMEWTRGVNFLEKAWLNFRNFFIKLGYDAWHGVQAVADIVWHNLVVGWVESIAWLKGAWLDFRLFWSRLWVELSTAAKRVWGEIKAFFGSDEGRAEAEAATREREERLAEISKERQAEMDKLEADRQRKRTAETARHEARLAEIGRENLQKHRELDNEYQRRMGENEADLARARKEWQDALAEARRKREAKEAEGPGAMEGPEDLLAKVRGSLSGLGDLLQAARERTIGVAGTFNAAALLGLQAGGADERIASATERTAKGVDGLRQDVRNNRAAFA